ncbi:cytochrome c biogenesis protein [Bacillus sp. HMF5848]|uniref:cytochrome c biogenesis protein ResB n=1 Tax=Bacillus sp. HMF5848 TaxID=2495421 RepID=UPI000F767137|nr:cytochrome c biogenesis protein ResB [Bacillus sp. HMF5848]RSK27494.1 cytochrome c biogenesis protein [Bacillus sp. HMF5848]
MNQVKCECGHINPIGTVICEACGRTFEDDATKVVLDMRYDGSARRSQTYNRTIIDRIWNFFSSVKVGVWLIVITLIASSFGTIFPQKMYIPPNVDPAIFYEAEYGSFGRLYYELGFHHLYGSWWYMLLIASIGVSLVICSLDRVIPLYKALKRQGISRHESFLKRQRLYGSSIVKNPEDSIHAIKAALIKKKYRIREENGNLLAEKGRFSRWGPYVNHVGLIIFLIGSMLRFVPGMYIDDELWIREGETKMIPGTGGKYYLENEQFIFETYSKENESEVFSEAIDRVGNGMAPKNYQSNVVLYERLDEAIPGSEPELKRVKDFEIRVNQPLKFEDYALYQVSYKLGEMYAMTFNLTDKASGESFGSMTIDLFDPESVYDLGNGYTVEIVSYFPDFYFNDLNEPATKSKLPNNPAFVFKMITPDKPDGEVSFTAIQQTLEPLGENQYKMKFTNINQRDITALTVRLDRTLWILAIGGIIFMIGVIQGMYWNHRRIWVKVTDNNEVLVAAHTNKNWFTLKKEIELAVVDTGIAVPVDQLNQDKKSTSS